MDTKQNRRRIASFLAITFALTWSVGLVGYFMGMKTVEHKAYLLVAALSMLCPAVAAIIQQRLLDREPWAGLGLNIKGTHWRTVGITALVGMCMMPLAMLVMYLLGDVAGMKAFGHVSVTSERMLLAVQELLEAQGLPAADGGLGALTSIPAGLVLLIVQVVAVLSAVTVNAPFMLGEELGWRGYLWQRTAHWSGLRRVLFTGVVWGIWHAPLIIMGHNYPGFPVAGVFMMVVLCVLFALLFDWTRTRSRSVWSSMMLHGIINSSAGGFALFTWGGHPLLGSPVGVAGFVAFALLGAAVLLLDRGYSRNFLVPAPLVSAA